MEKRCVILFLFSLFGYTSIAQNQTVKITSGGIYYWEYLPDDYNLNVNNYPVVFFFHGLGERGDTEADLTKVLVNGPPKLVKNGTKFPFILISPQLKTNYGNWPPNYMDQVVETVKADLRIDLNRIYVTGLSLGGGGAWYYAQNFPDKIAALAPVCGSRNRTDLACNIAAENLPVWAFHGDADGTVSVNLTINMVKAINSCIPAPDPLALITIYPNAGHNVWDRAYRNDNSLHTPNIYQWLLSYSKSALTVDVGPDQEVVLPTNTLNVSSIVTSNDPISTYSWEVLSGPTASLLNSTSATVTLNDLVSGVYIIKLTVTDINGNVATDDLKITVTSGNKNPQANAGSDIVVKLPTNTVTLQGTGTDSDGAIVSYFWEQVLGVVSGIQSPNNATTNITGLVEGIYEYRLTVIDDKGASSGDIVRVTVNAADNILPVANAGKNSELTLPTNSITLTGSGSDQDGSIVGYKWEKLNGPTATLGDINLPNLQVSSMVEGIYTFRLTVTDNSGGTGFAEVQITVTAANQPPQVNAGNDITITLPTNSSNLTAVASDNDGTITSYLWEFVSGPQTPTLTNANLATCTVQAMDLAGTYTFSMTVTDDKGSTNLDQVKIIVNAMPVNSPPVANAGEDLFVTLPLSQLQIYGSGTDSDGSISTYKWSKVSGGIITLKNTSSDVLNVSAFEAGTFVLSLTVTDNLGLSASDQMVFTVSPEVVNKTPVSNAGSDKSVTLPQNSVVFTGTGSDIDGTIVSYSWKQISGTPLTLSGENTFELTVTDLVEGNFSFSLTVTDDKSATATDNVNLSVLAINQVPTAYAGVDIELTLPENTCILNGIGDDPDGTIVNYFWQQISGPSTIALLNPNLSIIEISNLIAGNYVFRLTVTDNNGAVATDDIKVIVNEAVNISPIVTLNPDIQITLPVSSVNITGSAKDSDGTIVSLLWTQVSGPAASTLVNVSNITVTANNLVEGTYVFRLTATDDGGAQSFADQKVIVNPAATNVLPLANAGPNITINLPLNQVIISGSGSDADGTIVAYMWTKQSGPNVTLSNTSTATLTATNLVEGTYVFRLSVTDDKGAIGFDDVTVAVQPEIVNNAPVVNAGSNKTVVLPTDQVTISGSASDNDGSVVSYQWSQVSGPVVTLINEATPTVTVTGLVEGIVVLRLTVVDNDGADSFSDVVITVLPIASNVAPIANAGNDLTINLPTNTTVISGSGSDTDGSIVLYLWSKISGPSVTFTNQNTATLTVSNLLEGTYHFSLTVTDDDGATGVDEVILTVIAATVNKLPVVNAGLDKSITLPVNSVNINGTASDQDGSIVSINWSVISGTGYSISDPSKLGILFFDLAEGKYTLRLRVTDNNGGESTDDVIVTVIGMATNKAPLVGAGPDITIKLPVNTATLTGIATDEDGSIVSYLWTKVTGPACILGATNQLKLNLSELGEGTYTFNFKATDNQGAFSEDQVKLVVLAADINSPPVVNAGPDITLQLPDNSTMLSGEYSDDGSVINAQWTLLSGPGLVTTNVIDDKNIEVSGLLEGIYLFKFEATDNLGVSSSDEMKLVVLAAEVIVPNVPPTVDAGEDIVITLPENSVLISPFGSDADGMITEFVWRQVSGPLSAEMQFLPEGVLFVSNLIEGTYTFEVKVFDLDGATALDNVNVTVESEFAAVVPRNFFSPNGDGINDTWEIENYERLTDCLIEIYNLKGKLIFSEIGYQQSWDGSNNGAAVKSGVYYYFIRLKGTELIKSGTITLVK